MDTHAVHIMDSANERAVSRDVQMPIPPIGSLLIVGRKPGRQYQVKALSYQLEHSNENGGAICTDVYIWCVSLDR